MADSPRLFLEHRIDELRRLFESSEGADINFVCGGMTRKVHRFVLQLGSGVLDGLCSRLFQEGLNGRIELREHEPHLVYRMLQHLYMIDYSASAIEIDGQKEESFVSEPHTLVMMYALGVEYDINDLKEEALWKFNKAIEAKKGQNDELTSVLRVVPIVYATTPVSDRGLRDAVVAYGAKNLAQMKDLPNFECAVSQAPNYIVEVLSGFFHKLKDERRRYKKECQVCHRVDQWRFSAVLCLNCKTDELLYRGEYVDAS